jgi:hypothetical protein
LVVVGDLIGSGEAQERGIVGETPNLAARLQNIADPNTVVIAESTRKLLGNLFDVEDLGAQDLKGIGGPVRAWAVLRPASVESRFEALHATGLTELVGREEEFELLSRRWSRAKNVSRFVVGLVRESLDLKAIMGSYVSGLGQPPFDPRMMVSLLLHGYASGLYSSRRIARACCERNDFVMIVALDPPDFRTGELWDHLCGYAPAGRDLHRENSQGRQAGRPPGTTGRQVRAGDKPQDR